MQAASTYHSQTAPSPATVSARLTVQVLTADEAGLEAYSAFCDGAVHAPALNPLWVRAWLRGAGKAGLICLVSRDGCPALALALEVVRQKSLRIARFAGGSHANGNFPALGPGFPADAEEEKSLIEMLLSEIRRQRPDIDMLALERQRESLSGHRNPLGALPRTKSPDISLAADLSGGFDEYLDRHSGRRKRKRHRAQARKLEAAGGCRHFAAHSQAEIDRLLDAFFMLRRARFRSKGVADAFGSPRDQESFRALFKAAPHEKSPPFVLHGLEVGGRLRAVSGSSRTRDSMICDFTAFAEDELAGVSPGDFLFYRNIAEACAEGLTVYDFSVGNIPYKRSWCDIENQFFDAFVGLNAKGRLLAAGRFAAARMKRAVKSNPRLMRLIDRARKLKASEQ